MTAEPLLDVRDLTVEYRVARRGTLRAVHGVHLDVRAGETVGLVGESGSGKSTIGRAVLGLTTPTAGSIRFDGREIAGLRGRRRARLARDLQVVFQDPLSSLNPSLTVGELLQEPLRVVRRVSRSEAATAVGDLLERVSLPRDAAGRYPGAFSGGQRQRIAIARALSIDARLIVCDESVSALDVSTQASILSLLRRLQHELGVAYLFVSHDIAVVRNISQRIVVLYKGEVMERGHTAEVVDRPCHPYTRTLLDAIPVPDPRGQRERRERRLAARDRTLGDPPPVADTGTGCVFAARCVEVHDVCRTHAPTPVPVGTRQVACHIYDPASGHPRVGELTEGAADGRLLPRGR
ncbi:oligopeptide/dipeptide ABC transporter ATP-binding protein [Pseudonocardia sp. ICBG1293]|uniref:oligopeptide/dipeptide ABC transporter ATP-binding protein n=1 Tax=Pseudonocardia sp. ICBG1293 TaxID=2844382 RepID=UPI001CCA64E6|nr:oligopeptide/dipeptide ABC transporter ATP-binding protein [Pseudonocardia sp. ICBG1293]